MGMLIISNFGSGLHGNPDKKEIGQVTCFSQLLGGDKFDQAPNPRKNF